MKIYFCNSRFDGFTLVWNFSISLGKNDLIRNHFSEALQHNLDSMKVPKFMLDTEFPRLSKSTFSQTRGLFSSYNFSMEFCVLLKHHPSNGFFNPRFRVFKVQTIQTTQKLEFHHEVQNHSSP